IGYDDIQPILQTGVSGIALSGCVLDADNPIEEMKKIMALIHQ
ncbi:MAG: thiamine phosphate synthase, partial [Prevotella sp.]|nr:thiamine phosphate synthase [Prevotella sp.]